MNVEHWILLAMFVALLLHEAYCWWQDTKPGENGTPHRPTTGPRRPPT